MAYSLKIKDVREDTHIETNEPFLDVAVEINRGTKAKKELSRFGFPIDTPQKQIEKELAQTLKNLEAEDKRREADKEVEEKKAASQKVISNLKGKEI